jgi:uncharacterized protein YhaN
VIGSHNYEEEIAELRARVANAEREEAEAVDGWNKALARIAELEAALKRLEGVFL